jgi:hypothetical protein
MAIDAGPAIPGQKKRINWSNIPASMAMASGSSVLSGF